MGRGKQPISPINAPHLWEALQSSDVVNRQLGLHAASLPSEVAYLEALAESYSNAASWDTRRQVLSVTTEVASFKAISTFIPGLIQYRYTMAKLHGVQHGRNEEEIMKKYLEEKFNIGQSTGSKIDPAFVAKEMRRSRGKDGERLFVVSEFLTPQQVSSFFSRLALKVRQQQVEVLEEDALAVEEQSNFATAKENVLSSLQLRHPIIVDQYNVCSLVNNKSEFRKTKVALLQHLCERLELNTPVPAVRRKAPYVELLEEVVNSCCCNPRK